MSNYHMLLFMAICQKDIKFWLIEPMFSWHCHVSLLNMSNGRPFYAHLLQINVIMVLKYVGFKFLMKGNLQNSAV
jgi:hypothetical protein